MESVSERERPPELSDRVIEQETESSENFQKFIYDLFQENGILNDLRAYLRGQIVNVLKNARTGELLPCQKHFTQRLELPYQALNILIAEYLLHLDISYSLSVFVSEIPLANMVFEFAKTLMHNAEGNHDKLKFTDSDVWSILNYLGVKCDSEHASNVIERYKGGKNLPLLLCILKSMPMYSKESIPTLPVNSSTESVESCAKNSDNVRGSYSKQMPMNVSFCDSCKHYLHCKACQNQMARIKHKYRKKKKNLAESAQTCNLSSMNLESLLKNVSVVERSLIEEMFEELKSVYEAEVGMIKAEEENRVKRSIADHAIRLQKRRDELEECFKTREQELERNIQEKKKFLWGLARALREQHSHMMKAMRDVKIETKRLTAKEDSLKIQIADAEKYLKQRGEEMRKQISNELEILGNHLECMKNERENINKERTELEQLRNATDNNNKLLKIDKINNEEVENHYELLKNELIILKKYIEATNLQPKCVIERSTITELNDISSKLSVTLNNGHGVDFVRSDDGKIRSSQVVNDLKKPKNVNFSQSNLAEIYRERSRERSRSSASSEAGDANNVNVQEQAMNHLSEENERLKTFARQQREHIDDLLSQQARLQAELTAVRFRSATDSMPHWRPRTAPTVMPRHNNVDRLDASASVNPIGYGWRKGAGEELSLFSNAQPQILVPGDVIPFIGVLRERRNDARLNQWRSLHRRVSPVSVISKARKHSPAKKSVDVTEESTNKSDINLNTTTHVAEDATNSGNDNEIQIGTSSSYRQQIPNITEYEDKKKREKSPKSVLREAMQKLKNKDTMKDQQLHKSREKSPNTVLKEAKLRLRKLEIEAEAVEQSYMEYKKRQIQVREKQSDNLQPNEDISFNVIRELDTQQSKLFQKPQHKKQVEIPFQIKDKETSAKVDFEKYLKAYQVKFDIGETHFKNRNTAAVNVKPVPDSYKLIEDLKERKNYLETPLTEFRKLYISAKRPVKIDERINENQENVLSTHNIGVALINGENVQSPKDLDKGKYNKEAELEILKSNIDKIYNLSESVQDKSIEKPLASSINCNNSYLDKHDSNQVELETAVKLETKENSESPKLIVDENVISIEIESIIEVNNIVDDKQEISIVNSIADNMEEKLESIIEIQPQMTIIVSPKILKDDNDDSPTHRRTSDSKLPSNNQSDDFNAIQGESNAEMHLELLNEMLEESVSDLAKGDEIRDDFSADVDNYDSRSDFDNEIHSPVSVPKMSDDENFWES